MTDERDYPEGSPEYWRAMYDRLEREGKLPDHMPTRDELAADEWLPAGGKHRRTIPPAPVPAPDPFDALNVLEAAGYLEAMRQAVDLIGQAEHVADELDDPEFVAELEERRAEARALFERKFFEVN